MTRPVIVKIPISAVIVVLVLFFLPRESFTQQKQAQPHAPKDESQKQSSTTEKIEPSTVSGQPAIPPVTEGQPGSKEHDADGNLKLSWPLRPEWMMVWLTTTYIIVTYRMLRAISRQTAALMNAERALVIVTMHPIPDISPDLNRLEMFSIAPVFKNCGKTTATIISAKARAHILNRGEELAGEPVYTGEVKEVHGRVPLPPTIYIQPISTLIDSSQFPAIYREETVLYIYGLVEYLDAFERRHETRFCYLYHVPRGFDPRPRGLYMAGPETYNRCT